MATATQVSKQNIPYVHVDHATLYHGSATGGIKVLLKALDSTVGQGTYFTSERDKAEYYALIRSDRGQALEYDKDAAKDLRQHIVLHNGKRIPVVYEVEVENMDFVDIRDDVNNEKLRKVAKGFREYLVNELEKEKKSGKLTWWWEGTVKAAIGTIDILEGTDSEYRQFSKFGRGRVKTEIITPKDVLHGVGNLFSNYLKGLSFDGILAIEGGEGQGNHDSYVIFDSDKIKIVETVKITKTVIHSEPLEKPGK